MAKNDNTSAIIDNILRLMTIGDVLSTALFAPNLLQMLDKPLQQYFNRLDRCAQERE